jgi:alpha-D-ribose 1-methylphosphonate 5-triphosphate synthase subunit PhnH
MRPGFADPVLDSQAAFRALLEAMARPGRVQRIAAGPDAPGLMRASAAALLTLADAETPVWTDAEAAREWIAFHTGARFAEPGEAMFLLAVLGTPPLASLNPGTDEAPQEGATLIVEVSSLREGEGWRLTGPGIGREHRLRADGLPADFAAQWAANATRFPRGVDVVLCCGDRLAALPRTTRLEES